MSGRRSVLGSHRLQSEYVPYAGRLRRKAYLPGRLAGCVDIIDAFSPTCRESRQWLLHNAVYGRMKAGGRNFGWLRRLVMGSCGRHLGHHARLCRMESVEMGIYGALASPRVSYTPIHPIMHQASSRKSTHRPKSVDNIDT